MQTHDVFVAAVFLAMVYAFWDYGKTRLRLGVEQHTKILQQTNALAKALHEYVGQLAQTEVQLRTTLTESSEYQRAVLQSFINSATQIITISEEEKKLLRNKLNAVKMTAGR